MARSATNGKPRACEGWTIWEIEELERRRVLSTVIYDARVVNIVDQDGDGYARELRVEWDVDHTPGLRSVYMKVYEDDVFSDDLLYTSPAWTVSGTPVDWRGGTFGPDNTDLPGEDLDGLCEFRLELYDSSTDELITTRTASNDPDLGNRRFESSAEDTPPPPSAVIYDTRITSRVDEDGDGFVRQLRVEWDVDVPSGSRSVYMRVYENDVFSNDLLYTSSDWTASGSALDWRGTTLGPDDADLPGDDFNGVCELRLELYDALTDILIATRTESNDSDLENLQFESSSDDIVPPPSAVIDNARIVDRVDHDDDGFARELRVEWDVDVPSGSRSVFMRLYEDDAFNNDLLYTSSAWTASGSVLVLRGRTLGPDDADLPGDDLNGVCEFRLELYDALTEVLIATLTTADDANLDNARLEISEQDNTLPTMPGEVVATDVMPTSARLTWTASSDADGDRITYAIERREDGQNLWQSAGSVTSTTAVIYGLEQGRVYHIRTRALDGAGESEWRVTERAVLPVYIGFRDGSTIAPSPDVSTWIVIHGKGGNIEGRYASLAEAIDGSTSSDQVLMIDWRSLADDGFEEEFWIPNVAAQAARQLTAWGFGPSATGNLNLVGHSWGGAMTAEIARRIPGGVNRLVALDPAKDWWPGTEYDPTAVNFASHSRYSIAFLSSFYGSARSAQTADDAFIVTDPSADGNSAGNGEAWATSVAHNSVVSLFAAMVTRGPAGTVSRLFDLTDLSDHNLWDRNRFFASDSAADYGSGSGNFDGLLGASGDAEHWVPVRLRYFDHAGQLVTIEENEAPFDEAGEFLALYSSMYNPADPGVAGESIVTELTSRIGDYAFGRGYWGGTNYWFQDSAGNVWSLWHGGNVHLIDQSPQADPESSHWWVLTNLTAEAGLSGEMHFAMGSMSGIATGWNAFNIQGVNNGRLVALWWSPDAGLHQQGLRGNGWQQTDLSDCIMDLRTNQPAQLSSLREYSFSQGSSRDRFDPRQDPAPFIYNDGMSVVIVDVEDYVFVVSFRPRQHSVPPNAPPQDRGQWVVEPLRDVPGLTFWDIQGRINELEHLFVIASR